MMRQSVGHCRCRDTGVDNRCQTLESMVPGPMEEVADAHHPRGFSDEIQGQCCGTTGK